MATLPVFYINLASRPDRREFMEKQFVALGIKAERVEAVVGEQVPADLLAIHASPHQPWRLTAAELACGLSHHKAWSLIAERQVSAAVVLEDDVELSPELLAFLDPLQLGQPAPDLIKLETWRSKVWLGGSRRAAGTGVVQPLYSTHLGAAGYLMYLGCAQRSIADRRAFDVAVDQYLFGRGGPHIFDSTVLQAVPCPCVQISHLPSYHRDHPLRASDLKASRSKRPGGTSRTLLRRLRRDGIKLVYGLRLIGRLLRDPRAIGRGRRPVAFVGDAAIRPRQIAPVERFEARRS